MGDRSNIVIVNTDYVTKEKSRIWLYGHWMGPGAIGHAVHGLKSGRISDESYLARIIFSSMVKNDIDSETGYGISTMITDNEYPIIVIDPNYSAPTDLESQLERMLGGEIEGCCVWIESESGDRLTPPTPASTFVSVAEGAGDSYEELIDALNLAASAKS